MENYVGRFFAADVLEYIMEYGNRLKKSGANLTPEILSAMNLFEKQFEKVKDLVTPNQKPIYEMTLEEFEKIMNI
jgi:septation ring formation regulator EzrA